MTDEEKMLNSLIYDPSDKYLSDMRVKAHQLCIDFNRTDENQKLRAEILDKLIPNHKKNFTIEPPFHCDYGKYINLGENFYANFNLTILDCGYVNFGNDVYIGPNCSIVTPIHPMLPRERNMKVKENGDLFDFEYAKPINIGNNVWIATNVTVTAGVTIGDNVVIGAGSVVTRDIPSDCFAAGNPCKVIRKITENDSVFDKIKID